MALIGCPTMRSRLSELGRPMAAVKPLSENALRLFLTSASLLFVELLLIRWIPANVKYIGFFSNFLLMASFLGIGVGILVGRDGRSLPVSPFAPLLLGTTVLVGGGDEIFFGLEQSTSADINFVVLPIVIVLVVALMASLALPLGPLLRS